MSDETRLPVPDRTSKTSFHFNSSDFSKIVESPGFIDKTLLVKAVLNAPKILLITAPRLFGKTTNMDMLQKFLEVQVDLNGSVVDKLVSSNYNIFHDNNLLIYQDREVFQQHFGNYCTVHANFRRVSGSSVAKILEKFKFVCHETFNRYSYLLKSSKLSKAEKARFHRYCANYKNLTSSEVEYALVYLCECMYKHFDKKVFLLLDDYDGPMNNTMFKETLDINKVDKLLHQIFVTILKNNPFIDRAVLTGISHFASVGLAGVPNIEVCLFLQKHPFVPFYGATDREVADLFAKFRIDDATERRVRSHYNGYTSLSHVNLYSIWSILHFLKYMEIKNFWERSDPIPFLKVALDFPLVRYYLENLWSGKSVVIEILKTVRIGDVIELKKLCLHKTACALAKPDLYLNFVLQQGCLTYVKEIGDLKYEVRVPNAEIVDGFKRGLILPLFESIDTDLDLEQCAVILSQLSPSAKDETFRDFIDKFSTFFGKSRFKFTPITEGTYQLNMYNILLKAKSLIGAVETVVFEGKTNFYVFCNERVGFIIKINYKRPGTAIKQIIERHLNAFHLESSLERVTEKIYMGLDVNEDNSVNMSVLVNCTDISKARRF